LCQSSSKEKLEEEKKGLVVKVRSLKAELRSATEREKKASEKAQQLLERKNEDFLQRSPSDSSQVYLICRCIDYFKFVLQIKGQFYFDKVEFIIPIQFPTWNNCAFNVLL
jgi:hypothetical protein